MDRRLQRIMYARELISDVLLLLFAQLRKRYTFKNQNSTSSSIKINFNLRIKNRKKKQICIINTIKFRINYDSNLYSLNIQMLTRL